MMGVQWYDFVVFTAAKKDNLFVERISSDQQYWENVLLPALTTFYTQYVVPEILLHHLLETRVLSMNPSSCSSLDGRMDVLYLPYEQCQSRIDGRNAIMLVLSYQP